MSDYTPEKYWILRPWKYSVGLLGLAVGFWFFHQLGFAALCVAGAILPIALNISAWMSGLTPQRSWEDTKYPTPGEW